MAKALTATTIESLQKRAKTTGKRQTTFDARTPGLAVRITPAGHIGYYVMSRGPKDGDGKASQVWAEIRDGNAPVTTLAKARELAPQGVAAIKNGRPAYPKIEALEEVETYEGVVDRFIRQYAKPRQRTWKETERVLKAAPWKERAFSEITSKDADKYLSGLVEAEKKASARVALAWLKTLWRWAQRRHIVQTAVMDVLRAEDFGITKKTRERFYSDAEVKALWNATSDDLTTRERAFLKLSVLLSVRAGALAGMRKSELDDPANPTLWTVPTTRTKTRKSREKEARVYLIPIPPLARRVLSPLLKDDGDLVFPSATRRGVAMDCGSPLARKIREASGVEDWYHHAHRHTVTTWLQNHGHDEYDRALVLQHAGAGTVTGGYSHGYSLDRARELLEKWADHVGGVVAGQGAELLA